MEMKELLKDYKKPNGQWTEKPLTRDQRRRLTYNFEKFKVSFEDDDLKTLNRSEAQFLFHSLKDIREEYKVAQPKESKTEKKGLLGRLRK